MASLTVQRDAGRLPPRMAACVGAFDGFHRGHQALIEVAKRRCPTVAAVTFEPHPLHVLAPQRAPRLLQSPTQRERVAESLGLSRLVLLPFDRSLALLDPEAFAARFLVGGLRPELIVVGADFRFGAGRAGTPALLRELVAPHGIETEIVEPIPHPLDPSRKLSSTDVRNALECGDVVLAKTLLGRWHAVAGAVVPGAARGRDLGFRTANVEHDAGYLPPPGVYASALTVWDPRSPRVGSCWPSVTSLGRNATFVSDGPLSLEAHVMDADLGNDLYGVSVEVSFIARLREDQRFSNAAALVAQIEADIAHARAHVTPEALQSVLRPGDREAVR